ncbi:hypothetical protein BD779DRAFT_1480967 [Infundibulicybe gibba]|nr:hypothetical protein BD779DRAFT_1480967 [Infundibulicybe gibba]
MFPTSTQSLDTIMTLDGQIHCQAQDMLAPAPPHDLTLPYLPPYLPCRVPPSAQGPLSNGALVPNSPSDIPMRSKSTSLLQRSGIWLCARQPDGPTGEFVGWKCQRLAEDATNLHAERTRTALQKITNAQLAAMASGESDGITITMNTRTNLSLLPSTRLWFSQTIFCI